MMMKMRMTSQRLEIQVVAIESLKEKLCLEMLKVSVWVFIAYVKNLTNEHIGYDLYISGL